MDKIIQMAKNLLEKAKGLLSSVYSKIAEIEFLKKFDGLLGLDLKWWLLIAVGAVLFIIILICIIVGVTKKKKVKFIVNGKKIAVKKVKYKTEIPFPDAPVLEGKVFIGWFKDKKLTKKFEGDVLNKNKKLKLYAGFEDIFPLSQNFNNVEEDVTEIVEKVEENKEVESVETVEDAVTESVETEETQPETTGHIYEEVINLEESVSELAYYYDEIRYSMLTYERASAFKDLCVTRKQVIAKMFQRDDAINLYLAVEPTLMLSKGYDVTEFDSLEFANVPTKKVVKNKQDFEEALDLIKETMTINNLVPSEVVVAKKIKSDEQTRNNGFVFYLKNENVITSAVDYYRYLRTSVNCYVLSNKKSIPAGYESKMILKIFKKDESVILYLALNAEREGLEFVGYDKNFADTPAMLKINTADDIIKANRLIDRLMNTCGLERCPEKAEAVLDSDVQTNCGFGYRIRK